MGLYIKEKNVYNLVTMRTLEGTVISVNLFDVSSQVLDNLFITKRLIRKISYLNDLSFLDILCHSVDIPGTLRRQYPHVFSCDARYF